MATKHPGGMASSLPSVRAQGGPASTETANFEALKRPPALFSGLSSACKPVLCPAGQASQVKGAACRLEAALKAAADIHKALSPEPRQAASAQKAGGQILEAAQEAPLVAVGTGVKFRDPRQAAQLERAGVVSPILEEGGVREKAGVDVRVQTQPASSSRLISAAEPLGPESSARRVEAETRKALEALPSSTQRSAQQNFPAQTRGAAIGPPPSAPRREVTFSGLPNLPQQVQFRLCLSPRPGGSGGLGNVGAAAAAQAGLPAVEHLRRPIPASSLGKGIPLRNEAVGAGVVIGAGVVKRPPPAAAAISAATETPVGKLEHDRPSSVSVSADARAEIVAAQVKRDQEDDVSAKTKSLPGGLSVAGLPKLPPPLVAYPRRQRQPPPAYLTGPCEECGTWNSAKWMPRPNSKGCLCSICFEVQERLEEAAAAGVPSCIRFGFPDRIPDSWQAEKAINSTGSLETVLGNQAAAASSAPAAQQSGVAVLCANLAKFWAAEQRDGSSRECRLYRLPCQLQLPDPGTVLPLRGAAAAPRRSADCRAWQLKDGKQQPSHSRGSSQSEKPADEKGSGSRGGEPLAKRQKLGAETPDPREGLKTFGQPGLQDEDRADTQSRESPSCGAPAQRAAETLLGLSSAAAAGGRKGKHLPLPDTGLLGCTGAEDEKSTLLPQLAAVKTHNCKLVLNAAAKPKASKGKRPKPPPQPDPLLAGKKQFKASNLKPSNPKHGGALDRQNALAIAVSMGILDSPSRGVPSTQQWRSWSHILRRAKRGFHPDSGRTMEDIVESGFP